MTLLLVLILTSILPFYFLAPPPETSESFDSYISGELTSRINNRKIEIKISFERTEFLEEILDSGPVSLRLVINLKNYDVITKFIDLTSIDSKSNMYYINLSLDMLEIHSNLYFDQSIDIKYIFYLFTNTQNYSSIIIDNQVIGRFDNSIREKWFFLSIFITAITLMFKLGYERKSTWISIINNLQNRNNEIIKNFSDEFEYKDERIIKYFYFFITLQIINNFLIYEASVLQNSSFNLLFLYKNNVNYIFFLIIFSFLFIHYPTIILWVEDKLFTKKTLSLEEDLSKYSYRLKYTYFYLPFIIIKLLCLIILFKINILLFLIPNEVFLFFIFGISFLVDFYLYRELILFNSFLYDYKISNIKASILSFVLKLFYSVLIHILAVLFIMKKFSFNISFIII